MDREVERVAAGLGRGAPVDVRGSVLSEALVVEGIALAAEEREADLVALGTHGYGPIVRFLLGSHAPAVARTLRRPLLLVPRTGSASG